MMEEGISPYISVPDTIAELLAVGASVPIGSKGRVYVKGRNDMATSQKLGISWVIKDPEGITPEGGEYTAWEYGSTGPDATHEFIYPHVGREPFDIDKPGTWTIAITLFMNPDSPVAVDSYTGVLCVVAEVVEVFAGTIVSMELKYDSVRGDIPVY